MGNVGVCNLAFRHRYHENAASVGVLAFLFVYIDFVSILKLLMELIGGKGNVWNRRYHPIFLTVIHLICFDLTVLHL